MPAIVVQGSASTGDPCGAPPRAPSSFSGDVNAGGKPAVRQGDAYLPHACPGSPPHGATASAGSSTVYINGKPAHRNGDAISCGSVGANGVGHVNIGG
jgi:uncharacterized Zn-binding protein involved in type VI secretion